jgi:hypothetical protein
VLLRLRNEESEPAHCTLQPPPSAGARAVSFIQVNNVRPIRPVSASVTFTWLPRVRTTKLTDRRQMNEHNYFVLSTTKGSFCRRPNVDDVCKSGLVQAELHRPASNHFRPVSSLPVRHAPPGPAPIDCVRNRLKGTQLSHLWLLLAAAGKEEDVRKQAFIDDVS